MKRHGAVLFGILLVLPSSRVLAVPAQILVSGQATIALLDTNGDGIPQSPPDCRFAASFNDPNLLVLGVQDTSGHPLQGCSGNFMATASKGSDESSDFVDMTFTGAPGVVGNVQLPTFVEALDESPPNPPPNGGALDLNQLTIQFPNGNAGGVLCRAGAPVAQVTTTDGTRLAVPLSFYPSSSNPAFLKIPNLPLSDTTGGHHLVDGYIPVTEDHKITVQVGGSADLVVDTDLDQLAPCAGGLGVPTATEWGLIGLMVSLLVLGIWAVSRRPGLAEALPL
jgi:hypothetical protein